MLGSTPPAASEVLRLAAYDHGLIARLLARFGMELELGPDGHPIKGSYWGDEEAGLLGRRLLARSDTPLHSILHETCHYVCMDAGRRAGLDTDASGDYDEENAVCYLQILLAASLPGFGPEGMLRDMDAWGYTFRLGSARQWFEQDAQDARQWLLRHELITESGAPTYRLREK